MQTLMSKKTYLMFVVVTVLALVLSACGGAATPAPTQDTALIQTQAAQTVIADLTQNAPPPPTQAPPPTAAPTLAPTEAAPPPGPTPDPSIPVAVVPTAAAGQPSAIANFNTTIFSGPGTNYVVYATLLGGRTVLVTGKSEDGLWWAISVPVSPDGNGWVNAGWVTVSNADGVPVLPTPPVPATVEFVAPGPDDPQVIALANVYVRTGPATNFPALRHRPGRRNRQGDRRERGWTVVGGAAQPAECGCRLRLGDGAIHPGEQCGGRAEDRHACCASDCPTTAASSRSTGGNRHRAAQRAQRSGDKLPRAGSRSRAPLG